MLMLCTHCALQFSIFTKTQEDVKFNITYYYISFSNINGFVGPRFIFVSFPYTPVWNWLIPSPLKHFFNLACIFA